MDISTKLNKADGRPAFTLIEIIVTMVILAIVAMIAVPMMSSAAPMQVRSAANRLAADLEYARNMAITHQRPFTVVFDNSAANTNGYNLQDEDGTLTHPVIQQTFVVKFANERSISRVRIPSNGISIDPSGAVVAITFDYLGTPYSGLDTINRLNGATVTLAADGFELDVVVEPMTGYVMIESP
jgi:prepilin-type N-terminal cleavage/methylation domain-containing protein